jgi:hypothetical protein
MTTEQLKAAASRSATVSRLRTLARWGYGAKGLIYIAVAACALLAAMGVRRSPTDTGGALRALFAQPLGGGLVLALAVALGFYAAWRLVEGVTGVGLPTGARGWARRSHRLFSALIHAGFAWSAMRLFLWQRHAPTAEQSTRDTATRAFHLPFGRQVLAVAGVITLVAAGYQFYRAWSAAVRKDLNGAVAPGTRTVLVALGRTGEITRGVVFLLIGGYLLDAARRMDPNEVRGFAGALQSLNVPGYGAYFLTVAAAGLLSLGLFLLLSARYQRL